MSDLKPILLEMSVTRGDAKITVMRLQRPINEHLLKLIGIQASEETRSHWRAELDAWFDTISTTRLKPNKKKIPSKTIFEWLYLNPYGHGQELENVQAMFAFLNRRGFTRNDVDDENAANIFMDFHEKACILLSNGDPCVELVKQL